MNNLKVLLCFGLLFFLSCQQQATPEKASFKVDFDQFTLDNGLNVIMHIDRSDPVVAVALTAHVGSSREKEGRTGFAHLFEHLLFLESENLGKGGLDQMSARIGGSGANGSTSRDRTNYFQTVPKDALEKMIWAEADKLGFFINTVTDPVLAKEKQVVKNEKRQGVDNRPYGHQNHVTVTNLYPKEHPYSWTVIGSLEDLQNATLQDVKDFYNQWYVPNNCTLVIAGDFDKTEAKALVEKYFNEIKAGAAMEPLAKLPAQLSQNKSLYHEDNFARLPQVTYTWPAVPQYGDDSYALEVLSSYLSEGKKAPIRKYLVDEKQLSTSVDMRHFGSELAGEIELSANGNSNTDLDQVHAAIQEALAKFEQEGITQADLDRIKAGQETDFYNGLSSVMGKAFQLAQYQIFAGDPSFINQDIQKLLAVSTEDVNRVYQEYLKDKPYVVTSFVPKGKADLALEGAVKANVIEEVIVQGAEEEFDASITAEYEPTPQAFDRTTEPAYGESPQLKVPAVWNASMDNGMQVIGIQDSEVPLVNFDLLIKGGQLLDDPTKVGVANLLGDLMNKGTASKTVEELEDAIQNLGASISVYTSEQSMRISGSALSRNYDATMQLVQEMLLSPRWDATEFQLAKQQVSSQLQRQASNPRSIAALQFQRLLYGENHILSQNILGTDVVLESLTIDDLKNYYDSKLTPQLATLHLVGDISKDQAVESLAMLKDSWTSKTVDIPAFEMAARPSQSTIYFYDVPGAKQSLLRFGYPALKANDPDYYKATVMNYRLGGGGFASQLTQELREGKGYTYGIFSEFSGTAIDGSFSVSSGVRSNVTFEATQLVKDILTDYSDGFSEEDLAVTKGFMTKSSARSFETLRAKLGMLRNISQNGWSADYASQRMNQVKELTLPELKALANKYINPDQMIYLVVGDAATQMDRLEGMGFGKVVPLKN